jgi:hypothetical protein
MYREIVLGDKFLMAVGLVEVVIAGPDQCTVRWKNADGKYLFSKISTRILETKQRHVETLSSTGD